MALLVATICPSQERASSVEPMGTAWAASNNSEDGGNDVPRYSTPSSVSF